LGYLPDSSGIQTAPGVGECENRNTNLKAVLIVGDPNQGKTRNEGESWFVTFRKQVDSGVRPGLPSKTLLIFFLGGMHKFRQVY
jgi:hypothetical protein